MAEEVEIGRFLFGLKVFRHPDGNLEYRTHSFNENIPIEIIIMQIKTFLNKLEKDYFDKFT